jgi:hypothetical protein
LVLQREIDLGERRNIYIYIYIYIYMHLADFWAVTKAKTEEFENNKSPFGRLIILCFNTNMMIIDRGCIKKSIIVSCYM